MKLSDFDYVFPKELIAYRPVLKRDESMLLVLSKSTGRIQHKRFKDLIDYINKDDCVILNDTKVVPAALEARRSGGASILVLERIDDKTARCLVKPSKKFKKDAKVFFNNDATATVLEERPFKILKFSCPIDDLLEKEGRMPLPPYIKRKPDKEDIARYQTVYANKIGAVAAPTAGLHFTDDILSTISRRGVDVEYITLKGILKKGACISSVTLHVGWGTFRPVRCEDINDHKMHPEQFGVFGQTIKAINQARKNNGRILAVGTTSCRVLETIGRTRPMPAFAGGCTDLFIYPPYQFKLTDMLLTNFHQPKSTLLMLVSAFCGHDLMKEAYRQAVEKRYRLFSYGDAMLIVE